MIGGSKLAKNSVTYFMDGPLSGFLHFFYKALNSFFTIRPTINTELFISYSTSDDSDLDDNKSSKKSKKNGCSGRRRLSQKLVQVMKKPKFSICDSDSNKSKSKSPISDTELVKEDVPIETKCFGM